MYAAWLRDPGQDSGDEPAFPLVALVVWGGHTFLVEMTDHLTYRLLGQTVDDAAGEAFDKVGRLLGLPYPGGPSIQKAAESASRHDARFPRAWLGDSYDFSFSGLKTAARRTIDAARADAGLREPAESLPHAVTSELAWGFQDAVVDVLVAKAIRAARSVSARSIVLGGGVAANCGPPVPSRRRGRDAGRPAHRAPARPVHGQRGHDRRRGRPTVRSRGAGRPGPRGDALPAARAMSPAVIGGA